MHGGELLGAVARRDRRLVHVDVARPVHHRADVGDVGGARRAVLARREVVHLGRLAEVHEGQAAAAQHQVVPRVAAAPADQRRRRADAVLHDARRDAHEAAVVVDHAAAVAEHRARVRGLDEDAGALEHLERGQMDVVQVAAAQGRSGDALRAREPRVLASFHGRVCLRGLGRAARALRSAALRVRHAIAPASESRAWNARVMGPASPARGWLENLATTTPASGVDVEHLPVHADPQQHRAAGRRLGHPEAAAVGASGQHVRRRPRRRRLPCRPLRRASSSHQPGTTCRPFHAPVLREHLAETRQVAQAAAEPAVEQGAAGAVQQHVGVVLGAEPAPHLVADSRGAARPRRARAPSRARPCSARRSAAPRRVRLRARWSWRSRRSSRARRRRGAA